MGGFIVLVAGVGFEPTTVRSPVRGDLQVMLEATVNTGVFA